MSRCAVLVVGAAEGVNPQTAPRLTVTGLASIEEDPALRARWVARHPYAAFYAGFGDFFLWRVRPVAGLFVGGFARAHRLRQAELLPDAAAVAAVAAAEAEVIAHCNGDHGGCAGGDCGGGWGIWGDGWRMAAVDTDGFDLVQEEVVCRVHWEAPVDGANAIRAGLIHLARAARNGAIASAGLAGSAPV